MLVVSRLIALVVAISVWLFVRLSPVGADAIAVRRFNRASFALCIVVCLAIFGWAYESRVRSIFEAPPDHASLFSLRVGKPVGSLYLDQPRTSERKTRLRHDSEKGLGVFIPWRPRCRRFAHFQEIWYTLPTEGGTIFFRVNSSLRRSRCRIVSAE